jgi:NTP pyrophosphatase (non-canonical NTP hydrolase)
MQTPKNNPGDHYEFSRLLLNFEVAADDLKKFFDKADKNELNGLLVNVDQVRNELADVQVVLFFMAETLSEWTGVEFDVVASAVEKSGRDVERGVR